MSVLDRLIERYAPRVALRREQARHALRLYKANYDAAGMGKRTLSRRPSATDADGAAVRRARLAYIARDMVRNTPFALRAQTVILNNVVGSGITYKVEAPGKALQADLKAAFDDHFGTTAIDADGRDNLFGLQCLALAAIVDAGEVLIRRRRRERADGLPLPFQLEVLEADHLDTTKDQPLDGGRRIREGIEYDAIGRRTAYWLFDDHPGASWSSARSPISRRIPASEVLHVYRRDRPKQQRGVTWFAPIALTLQDLDDHQDAQLMRQKVAACFAAFRTRPATEKNKDDPGGLSSILPGRIQNLDEGEEITFGNPPQVEGYDDFTSSVLRSAAAGMGLTYEALTGDLRQVNFSSARMGRMEMNRQVERWQWLMMLPQLCMPIAQWALEAYVVNGGNGRAREARVSWVPPHLMLVDPTREIPAMREEVRAGFASRQGQIRRLGYDPDEILAEQAEDKKKAEDAGLTFNSDAAVPVVSGVPDPQNQSPDPGATDGPGAVPDQTGGANA